MRRPFLVIAAAIAAIAVPAVVLLGLPDRSVSVPLGEPTASQVAHASSLLKTCIPVPLADSDNDCLKAQMTAAGLIDGPRAVIAAVRELSAVDPRIGTACHSPGHEMGRVLFGVIRNLGEALGGSDTHCDGAYIHGVFDAWVNESPDVEAYVGAALSCNALDESIHGSCFDGLGHVLWRSYPDVEIMSDVCSSAVTKHGRVACLGGVNMQRYVPLIGEATEALNDAPTGLRELCATLREWDPLPVDRHGPFGSEMNPNIAGACMSSSTYTLRALYLMDAAGPQLDFANGVTPELDRAIDAYLDACSSVIDASTESEVNAVAGCRSIVGMYIYLVDVNTREPLAREVCEAYFTKEPEQAASCNALIQTYGK